MCPREERSGLRATLEPLVKLAEARLKGPEGYAKQIAKDLLEHYLQVEEHFQIKPNLATEQDIIYALRQVSVC